jgi:hypothetical protein
VLLRARLGRIASGEQLRQCLFRAHVLHLEQFKIRFRLNRGGYREEAIETHGVVGSVVVLRSAIHKRRPLSLASRVSRSYASVK